jgi:hypothetical protein
MINERILQATATAMSERVVRAKHETRKATRSARGNGRQNT